jgi:hypothetical protein
MNATNDEPLRPRDFATLLLASGDLLPRQRARDQQADLAGSELKRRVLTRVIELDPESAGLADSLDGIVREIGDHDALGPARAIAREFGEEFEAARRTPQLVEWLLHRATTIQREISKRIEQNRE